MNSDKIPHVPEILRNEVSWVYEDILRYDSRLADRFLSLLNLACQGAALEADMETVGRILTLTPFEL